MLSRLRALGTMALVLLLTQCRASDGHSTTSTNPAATSQTPPQPAPSSQPGPSTVTFFAAEGNVYGPAAGPSPDDVVSRLSEYFSVRYGADELMATVAALVALDPNRVDAMLQNPVADANGVRTYAIPLTDVQSGAQQQFDVDDQVPMDASGYDADARDATWPVPMDANYAVAFSVQSASTGVVKWPIALEKAVTHALHICDGSGVGAQQQNCTDNLDGVPVADLIQVLTGAKSTQTAGSKLTAESFAGAGVSSVAVLSFPPTIVSTTYQDGSRVQDEEWEASGFGIWIQDGNQTYGLLPSSYAVTAADPNGTLTLRAPHGFGIVVNQTAFAYCDTPYCSSIHGPGSPTFTLPLKWAQRLADHLTSAPLQ